MRNALRTLSARQVAKLMDLSTKLAELNQHRYQDWSLSFTPILAPMPRGILATVTAFPATPTCDLAAVRAALDEAYGAEPFVRLLPDGRWPHTKATAGTNAAHLQAAIDGNSGRIVVCCAIDNLGKGAAGQAVQCANLMLGLPETAGLAVDGVAP